MKSTDVLCNGCGGEVLNVPGRPRMLAQKNGGGWRGETERIRKLYFARVVG